MVSCKKIKYPGVAYRSGTCFGSKLRLVRLQSLGPAQKFPSPLRFRLCRKLRYDGNFFAFGPDPLRWIPGREGREIRVVDHLVFVLYSIFFMEKHESVYIFLALRTLLSLIADFFLIPYWSVYGAAVSNILVNTVLAVTGLALPHAQKYIRICWFKNTDFAVLKAWCRMGAFSGLPQFVDNLIYAVMICKMVNLVSPIPKNT